MSELRTKHWEFADSLTCDCRFCSVRKKWLFLLRKLERLTNRHKQSCNCNLCQLLLQARKSTLISELKLNLWIELGWYAEIEKWQPGWETLAFNETEKSDKWWIAAGQYKPMNFWLEKFESWGKERLMYENQEEKKLN